MAAELKPDLPLEIAHLLLIDVVGYSKLLVNEQIESMQELNRIVRWPNEFFNEEGRFLVCGTHGSLYQPDIGRCAGGPCGGG
jgi:hypothetical protein